MARTDSEGFLNPPAVEKRVKFMRGDKVRVETRWFEGDATFVQFKDSGEAVVVPTGGIMPFVVAESSLSVV